jgi:hypothetical protein
MFASISHLRRAARIGIVGLCLAVGWGQAAGQTLNCVSGATETIGGRNCTYDGSAWNCSGGAMTITQNVACSDGSATKITNTNNITVSSGINVNADLQAIGTTRDISLAANSSVGGSVTAGGTLSVANGQNVSIAQNATCDDFGGPTNTDTQGAGKLYIGGKLTVKGVHTISFRGPCEIAGGVETHGITYINAGCVIGADDQGIAVQNTEVNYGITVDGTVDDPTVINGKIDSGLTIAIGQYTTINGDMEADTSVSVNGTSDSPSVIKGNIVSGSSSTLSGYAVVDGGINANTTFSMGKYTTVHGDVVAKGSCSVSGSTPVHAVVDGNLTCSSFSGTPGSEEGSACPSNPATDPDFGDNRGCNITIGGILKTTSGNAYPIGRSVRIGGLDVAGTGELWISHDTVISENGIKTNGFITLYGDRNYVDDSNPFCGKTRSPCNVEITGDVIARGRIDGDLTEGLRVYGDLNSETSYIDLEGSDAAAEANNEVYGNVRSNSYFRLGQKGIVDGNVYATGSSDNIVRLQKNASVTGCIYSPQNASSGVQTNPANSASVAASINTNPTGKGVCCYNPPMSVCNPNNNCLASVFEGQPLDIQDVSETELAPCHINAPLIEKTVNGDTEATVDDDETLTFEIKVTPSPMDMESTKANLWVEDRLDIANLDEILLGTVSDGTATINADGVLTWSGIHQNLLSATLTFHAKAKCSTSNFATVYDTGRTLEVASNTVNINVNGGACGQFFEATESGAETPAVKNLFTKVADNAFVLRIWSVTSENGDAASVGHCGEVEVGLYTGEGDLADCKAATPSFQTVSFGSNCLATDGTKTSEISHLASFSETDVRIQPKARVWMRAKGATEAFCSSDTFSVRTEFFSLVPYKEDGTNRLINTNSSTAGDPADKAGKVFVLKAEATAMDDYKPVVVARDETKAVSAHYGTDQTFDSGDLREGTMPASLDANPDYVVAYAYDEIGTLSFAEGTWHDQGNYVRNSGSGDFSNDCLENSSANTKDETGRFGCNVPSQVLNNVGRWFPAMFKLEGGRSSSGQPEFFVGKSYATCSGACDCLDRIYMDQQLPVAGLLFYPHIVAQSASGKPVNFYDYQFSGKTSAVVTVPWNWNGLKNTDDAGGLLVNRLKSNATKPYLDGLTFMNGILLGGAQSVGGSATNGATSFIFRKLGNRQPDGPYALRLAIFRNPTVESDPVEIVGHAGQLCPKWTSLGAATTASDNDGECLPEDRGAWVDKTIQVRYGRLDLHSAYGPSGAALPVPVNIQYWNDGRWEINEADQCTILTYKNVLHHDDKSVPTHFDKTEWDAHTGTISGMSGEQISDGKGAYILLVQGAEGDVVNIDACAMGVYDTTIGCTSVAGCNVGGCNNGWLDPDTARICIGRCGQRQPFIFKRQVISP